MKNIILLLFFNFAFSKFINWIFLSNRTAFIIINSTFLFLSISLFLVFIELELLAITFAMVYIGGIAVMFLFLILLVEVNFENITRHIKYDNRLNLYFIVFIIIVLYYVVNFNIFNFFITYSECVINFFIFEVSDYFTYFVNENYIFELPLYSIVEVEAINDVIISKPVFLFLISIYLMVATFVSLILCSTPFEKFVDL